ncbi:hypothetical protein SAMD00019534_061460, partial [Acytostelium subglobosum LB1]|uniref:hypothetical protein n=1 Tax=Acytostelium subglobosum LB1 TaxID=1410327 RepID=UPI000644FB13
MHSANDREDMITKPDDGASVASGKHQRLSCWQSGWFYFKISIWFFGSSVVLGAMTSIVWPYQLVTCFGAERKEYWNGVIPISGVFINFIMTTVSGYMSDHIRTKFGKRRPFLLAGTIIMIAFLFGLSSYNDSNATISGFILMEVGFYFGQGVAAGAFSGIIPDLVHLSQTGMASGWLGVMWSLGTLIGAIGGGVLVQGTTEDAIYIYCYGFVIALLAISTIIALVSLHEDKCEDFHFDGSVTGFFRSLYLPSHTYYNFYWIILTRFFNTMGCHMIISFLFYFAMDVVGQKELIVSSIILVTLILCSIPSSIVGGLIADRYNITKGMVYASSCIQFVAVACMIALSFGPSFVGLLVVVGFFGIGYGCYQCVDWALALRVLPGHTIAKDMGIWHVSFNAPMVFAPFITANILAYMKLSHYTYNQSYAVVFGVASIWFILATAFIYPLKDTSVDKNNNCCLKNSPSNSSSNGDLEEIQMKSISTNTAE